MFVVSALPKGTKCAIILSVGNEAWQKGQMKMSDEVWLQHWMERRTMEQNEDGKEIANMDSTDYAVLLEEMEHK